MRSPGNAAFPDPGEPATFLIMIRIHRGALLV